MMYGTRFRASEMISPDPDSIYITPVIYMSGILGSASSHYVGRFSRYGQERKCITRPSTCACCSDFFILPTEI